MTIRFHGGTGVCRGFRGRVAVSVTDAGTPDELWHWDCWYRFGHCEDDTRGYYNDGTRFLRDIQSKRKELGIRDEELVRSR